MPLRLDEQGAVTPVRVIESVPTERRPEFVRAFAICQQAAVRIPYREGLNHLSADLAATRSGRYLDEPGVAA